MFKWILGIGGYFLFGRNLFTGILGFILGTFIDNYQRVMGQLKKQAEQEGRTFSPEEMFNIISKDHLQMMFLPC